MPLNFLLWLAEMYSAFCSVPRGGGIFLNPLTICPQWWEEVFWAGMFVQRWKAGWVASLCLRCQEPEAGPVLQCGIHPTPAMCKRFPCRGVREILGETLVVCPSCSSSSSSSCPTPARYSQHWNPASKGLEGLDLHSHSLCLPVAFPSPSACASLFWSQPRVPADALGF